MGVTPCAALLSLLSKYLHGIKPADNIIPYANLNVKYSCNVWVCVHL